MADLDRDGVFQKEEKRVFYPALASAACKELLPASYQRRGVMPGPGTRGGGRLSGPAAPVAGAVTDAVGGPDAGGYRYADSDVNGFPVNFVSIRSTGTQLTLGDDTSSTQALPFPFPFYGQMRGSVDVASNGYLTFGSIATDFSNDCPVPSPLTPDAAVYGHWDDLLPNATNNVIVQSFAKGKCPGLRSEACFIAEWNAVPFFGGGGTATFQMVLWANGIAEVQVNRVTQGGSSATTGIENNNGTVGLVYGCNSSYLSIQPRAVYFLPPGVGQPSFLRPGLLVVDPNRQLGSQVHLPILNFQGQDDVCRTMIEVQYLGCDPSKAVLVTWGEPGFCPPQAAGPLKVECTGLLFPGTAWILMGAQIPTGSKSGMLFKFSAQQLSELGIDLGFDDIVADLMCETLFFGVVGDADDFRRFKKAYNEGLDFAGINQSVAAGDGFLAVEVLRHCPGDVTPGVEVSSKYIGIAGAHLGHYDPLYGGYGYYVSLVYAGRAGLNTVLYVQNGGLECSSLELWFKAQDDCLRARICDVATLAPGETYQFDASDCVGPDWQGSAWIRASAPMGIAVDIYGRDILMTYVGEPEPYDHVASDGTGPVSPTTGERMAFGPLIYSEYQGWDTGVQVMNLSQTVNAKVKAYFMDRSGDVITTLVDWICPRGSQTFFLPMVADLPGSWVGSIRVESQQWWTPGTTEVMAPHIVGVATLMKYGDVARTDTQEAMAYNLLPEHKSFQWQIGAQGGGLDTGVGLLAIPSLLKDLDGSGVTSETAIVNLVTKPGFTAFAIYIYDQNGLLDFVCEKLHDRQVEYIDLQTWGYVNNGFKGSAVISATFWEHDVFAGTGTMVRNLVGLGCVMVERTGTRLGEDIPGDEAAGDRCVPFAADEIGVDWCPGPYVPRCPGQPIFSDPLTGELSFKIRSQPGKPIRDNLGTSDTIFLDVPGVCKVTDLDISFDVSHTFFADIDMFLSHKSVVNSEMFTDLCGSQDIHWSYVTTLDDDAATGAGAAPCTAPVPPFPFNTWGGTGGTWKTEAGTGLSAFDGLSARGDWTFTIVDDASGDTGQLNAWTLIGSCK